MIRRIALALLLSALALPAFAATVESAAAPVVPFIDDDFPSALAQAQARNVPLFVDVWADWCHTCRSMRAFVFTDPTLAPLAQRFVWLEIDSEKSVNAPFQERYEVEGLPTLFVIDPHDGAVLLRWLGSTTAKQLVQLLDDTLSAYGKTGEDALSRTLARANRLNGEGKYKEAADEFRAVLKLAPAGWDGRARVTESLVLALYAGDVNEECANTAEGATEALSGKSSSANVAATGLLCALRLPAEAPGRSDLVNHLEKASRAALDDPRVVVPADDRSGVFEALVMAHEDAGDSKAVKAVAKEWAAFLDERARRAASPAARMVFDSHRLSAYLAMGEPQKAVPMLEQAERDAPNDYNPPARLAIALQAMGHLDEARAATDRALAHVSGPRRIRVLQTRASIEKDAGDVAAQRKWLQEALDLAKSLPEGQRSTKRIDALSDALAGLPQS